MEQKTMQKNSAKFGINDYFRMFLKRGLRLPIAYFLNAHLFDLIWKTDTHRWLPKESYEEKPSNFVNGVLYMTSWTNEIIRSFNALIKLNLLNSPYVFIDIGCGKGKVCLLWKKLHHVKLKEEVKVIGIDYYQPFIKIAKENFHLTYKEDGEFYLADATQYYFNNFEDRLVIYLYNPFNELIMKEVMKNIPDDTIVIYNNPEHSKLFSENHFDLIYEHIGWHPNCHTKIFIKRVNNTN